MPSLKALQEARLDIDGIEINSTHIRTDKDITLDLGGMGKGYGVDIALKYLKKAHISKGIIALSGDIRCLHPCEIYLQSFYKKPKKSSSHQSQNSHTRQSFCLCIAF